jgi:uncharacterized lipoprotein YddW (UPF0748 family)
MKASGALAPDAFFVYLETAVLIHPPIQLPEECMRSTNVALALLILSLAASHAAVSQTPPKREFRGVWIATVTNLDWPSTRGGDPQVQKSQLTSILDQLKANGVTAVVFQVRPECDALYYSTIEPWSYWLTGLQGAAPNPYYDPLQFALDEAHKRGMELHAWFNPYRAERVVGNYTLASNHVTVQHPTWAIQIGNFKFLDPGLPMVRDHVARVIADVVRRYDVDGIHFDDYFYPYPPNQITNQDDATFAAYPRGIYDKATWRRDNVNLLVRMVHDSIQAIKPYVKFGISPFGIWKNGVPPGIVGMDAYSAIYCDAIAWLQQQTIDYLTPQLYWPIGGSQDYSALMPWWADSTAAHARHLYPGQAAYRITSWSAAEMPNQIKLNRANPKVGGSVFFRSQVGVNDNPQGFADSLRNNYYKYPVLHPVMAWKDVVPPYPPRAIRYDRLSPTGPWALQWDLPNSAPDGDSAYRYAVYRFNHRPTIGEFADPRNILSIEGRRWVLPPAPPAGWSSVYYAVTALDRNYNESDTSGIVLVGPPAAPVLASPLDGTTALPESVVVRWRTTNTAALYHLQISTDPAFSGPFLVNDSTLVDTSRTIKGLAGLTQYSWRVRSANAAGFGPYASPFTFSTGFPPSPMLAYPTPGMTGVPVQSIFRWGRSPTALTYRMQVAKTSDFAAPVVDSTGLADTSLAVGPLEYLRPYFWRVRATNGIGTSGWSTVGSFRTEQLVSVEHQEGQPTEYSLSQNYPNPFNPTTQIRFTIPSSGRVTLKVYDVLGREEATLVDETMNPGLYTITWNAASAASGVYFYRLVAGTYVQTKRMTLVR